MGASFGVLAIVAALSLVAALAWGASRTHIAPTAFGDLATICTPGPTWTPTPKDYRPTPPTWSPEGPGPVITAGIETEAAWRNKYFAEGCDIGALPQVIAGTYDGAYAGSLREAVTTADFIVVGHVTSTTFRGDLGTPSPPGRVDSPVAETVIAVDTTIKGDVAGGLTLRQMASPLPYNGGMVVVAPSDRLLLPGDNVLILARHTPGVSGDVAEFPVGKYLTTHGVIHAVGGNPCDTIDGLSVAEASRIIVDFVQRGIADQRLAKQCDYSRFDAPYGTPSPTRSG
ncbi:MAG TPA: hypothetical protein VN636_11580 [Acidimicrobiia bacterium]|nr:hypothetical protein [Acidimicrobiia bacterium]